MTNRSHSLLRFSPGFDVSPDYFVICDKNAGSKYIAYESDYKGKRYFQIKEVYNRGDDWAPGKGGITISIDRKYDLLDGLLRLLAKEDMVDLPPQTETEIETEGDSDASERQTMVTGTT